MSAEAAPLGPAAWRDRNRFRVTLVNTHDLIGGAERCSYDLASFLHGHGDEVTLIVGQKLGGDSFIVEMKYHPLDFKLRSFFYGRLGLTDTTIAAPIYGCWQIPSLRLSDVYNIHNMHGGFWNFWTVPILAKRAPVVLTLHDEWLLTGDCAYSYGCERWRRSCGRCPQAQEPNPDDRVCIGGRDATWLNLKLKRAMLATLRADRVVLVSPSQWLLDRVGRTRHLARFRRIAIPNGVNLRVFRPQDRLEARRALGLPADRFLVLVLAANLFDRRKNLKLVIDAMRTESWPADATLILTGRVTEGLASELSREERCHLLGFLKTREELARAFGACDLVIVPSSADNLPYSALEAQACGTPVLGCRVGGIPETLVDNVSGWLFEDAIAPARLAAEVRRISELPSAEMDSVRTAARQNAEKRFGLDDFALAYRSLFEELATA